MAICRIHLLDAAGHVASQVDHDCADDSAATDLAIMLQPPLAQAEVWDGSRCIGLVCVGLGLIDAAERY
jgi:hypothetical protein